MPRLVRLSWARWVVACGLFAAVSSLAIGPVSAESVEQPDAAATGFTDPSVAMDANGFPVVAYFSQAADRLFIMHCNDPACAGGDESITSPVPQSGAHGDNPSLRLDSNGFPVVVYEDTDYTIRLLRCNDPNCEGGDETITTLSTIEMADPSLVLTSSDIPVIVWIDDRDNGIHLRTCDDPFCTPSGDVTRIIDSEGRGDPRIEMAPNGLPVVVFLNESGDVEVVECLDDTCAASGSETVDFAERANGPEIAFDLDGLPVLSARTSTGLYLIRCDDSRCADEDTSLPYLLSGSDNYVSPRLVLDASGNGVITFGISSPENGNRRGLVRCDDRDCRFETPVELPAGSAFIGADVTLDHFGNPVVVSAPLAVIRCNDPSCVPVVDDSSSDVGEMSAIDHRSEVFTGITRIAYVDVVNSTVNTVRCSARCVFVNDEGSIPLGPNLVNGIAAVADAIGRMAVVVSDTSDGGSIGLHVCFGGSCTANQLNIAGVGNGGYVDVELNDDGHPVLAFARENPEGLVVVECGDLSCSTSTINTPITTGEPTFLDLELGADGFPVIAYFEEGADDLRLLRCDDAACAGSEATTTVVSIGNVGRIVSMELNRFDHPVMAYRNSNFAGSLQIVRCNDRNCVGGGDTVATPDAIALPGAVDLRLDDADRPVVAYHDQNSADLRILHCDDEACAGVEEPRVVVATGDVGRDASLVLDKNNNAIVSHHDSNNGTLETYTEVGRSATPLGFHPLDDPCPAYDSRSGAILFGGDTVDPVVVGPLPADQGVFSSTCVPDGAEAVVLAVSAQGPVAAGNLRLSPGGTNADGGVVNYAPNGLNNSNTVTVRVSDDGRVRVAVNGGPGVPAPNTHVRLVAIGYYDRQPGLEYVPVTPCAASDSRPNQGALGQYVGPFGPDDPVPAIDVVGTFSGEQGGGVNSCGVPAGADAVLVNVVAINPTGGSGSVAAWDSIGVPSEATTSYADLGMNNAATTIIPVAGTNGTIQIDTAGVSGSTSHVRVVVLGYYDAPEVAGSGAFVPINPCVAFDSRPNQDPVGGFAGVRGAASTTDYRVVDSIPTEQGGAGSKPAPCGIPDDATSVLINLVALNAVGAGNLQVFATGTTPTGGVLNFRDLTPAMNNSNAVVVPISADGQISVFVNGGNVPVGTPLANVRGVLLGYFED